MGADFLGDVRHALRGLVLKTPGMTFVLVFTLALGIGANTAIFSVLNGVLFTPLPYEEPEELVTLRHAAPNLPGVGLVGIPGPDLLDYMEGAPSVEAFANVVSLETNLADEEGAARITIAWVTTDFFDLLGVDAQVGRVIGPDDWTPRSRAQMEDPSFTPPPMPVVLAHELWTARFGADASIVGTDIRLNGQTMTVLGILPEGFRMHMPPDGPVPSRVDAIAPLPIPLTEGNRGAGGGIVVARLVDGASLDRARSELERVTRSFRETYEPHARMGTQIVVEPLHDQVVGQAKSFLWVLFGAIGMVLLIAVINVANLLLVRAGARHHEFAVRSALGVGRARIVRQLLTESLIVALMGAVAGLVLADVGVRTLVAAAPPNIPRLESVGIDGSVMLFTLVVSTGAAVLFGLAPALASARVDGAELVSSRGSAGLSRGRLRLRTMLVVGEIALSVVLVVGAGLLFRSFAALQAQELGYEPEGAVAMDVALPFFTYRQHERRQAFFDELVTRAAELPGVVSAGAAARMPLVEGGANWSAPSGKVGADLNSQEADRARLRVGTPGMLEALGASISAGRGFLPPDEEPDAAPVILVDRRIAELHWPGENPVGRSLEIFVPAYTGQGYQTQAQIVGVVEPIRYQSVVEPGEPSIFLPYRLIAPVDGTLLLRGPADAGAMSARVRGIIDELDPGVPIFSVRHLSRDAADATAESRYALLLVGAFAVTALLLAAIGLYGVISTTAQQRTREIGVRMAMGALASDIGRLVVAQGGRLVVLGVGVGVVAALLLGPALGSLLYQVEPRDPLTLAVTATVLGLVALLATYLPARRAARLDPVDALRME